MRILVTNDDGIDSPGLHVLAQRLARLGEVTVFAPSGEYSGAGAAIGHIGGGIADVYRVERVEMADVFATYHLDGPPALATLLACHGLFGDPPDVVVSGINPGWNVGYAVHFSGTIGAGITADMCGVGAIAVSLHRPEPYHWETAAEAAAVLVPEVLADPKLLSVNVPNIAWSEVRGSKRTVISHRVPYGLHTATLSEVDADRRRFHVGFQANGPFERPEGCDVDAVEAGYVSVTELVSTRPAPISNG